MHLYLFVNYISTKIIQVFYEQHNLQLHHHIQFEMSWTYKDVREGNIAAQS